jgi:hypothetical protein
MTKKESGNRRELEPVHTKGYMHLPHLREKLEWLYGYHPFVNTQYQLASELKVSPATLSTWLNGTRYTDPRTVATVNPDSIPIKHYRSFLDIWGLPGPILEIEDLIEFKNALATFEAGRGPWEKLVRALPDDESIEIVANAQRGVIDPEDAEDPGIVQLYAGDEVLLRAHQPGARHAAMLLQDRVGWSSLRPNPRWPDTQVDGEIIFPRQGTDDAPRFARLDTVGGVHRVLVIFTEEPLPAGVLQILLARPMDIGSLNHTVSVLQNRLAAGPGKCRILSRRFLVSPVPTRKARNGDDTEARRAG